MKYSVSSLLLLAGTALAAPAPSAGEITHQQLKRAGITDFDILNYALTLEHLEDKFYRDGLAQFGQAAFDANGNTKRTRFNIAEVSQDEVTHVSFLTSAITAAGGQPVEECTYKFPYTDVKSFLALANILEGVGVSAYLGAAQFIANKDYLTAAGSILTVESRHSAYIRDNQMPPQSPFPSPFDIPLSINQVYTLASQFIVSCPSGNPTLPVKAFPALSTAPGTYNPARGGQNLNLVSAALDLSTQGQLYCAFPTVTGPLYAEATVTEAGKGARCLIPAGVTGQAYVVLTTSANALTDDNTVAGPAIVPIQALYTYPGIPE